MVTPDPPPNSLGLDLVQPEPVVDSQPKPTSVPSPPPQPTTSSSTSDTAATATETTTPTTGTTKVDDASKPPSKKAPYVNPDRVRTGGLPRDKLTDEELAERMAQMKEKNEKIKQRRLDVAADEDAFKQTQVAERQRQAEMRRVQDTVNRTREQNARRKMDKIQTREWDSEKKAEGWPTSAKGEQPNATTSASTTRTNTGEQGAEAEAPPTTKQREDTSRGRGEGRRGRGGGRGGRGRGRGKGESRDKAPNPVQPGEDDTTAVTGKVEEGE